MSSPARRGARESDIDPREVARLERLRPDQASAFVGLLRWIPVFAALGLLAQLGLRGVKPALAEQRALLGKEAELELRERLMRERRARAFERLEALDDPIYVERMRRMRLHELERELRQRGIDPRAEIDALKASSER